MSNEYLFFFVFPAGWIALLIFIAFISGWRDLARYYRYSGQIVERKRHWQSAALRAGASYRYCLTIGANHEGMYLSVLFPFRPAHPPLFIPWRDIEITRKSFRGFSVLELRLRETPSIMLRIPQALEEFLKETSGITFLLGPAGEGTAAPANPFIKWISVVLVGLAIMVAMIGLFAAIIVQK